MTDNSTSRHVSFYDPVLKATVEVRDFNGVPTTIRVKSHVSDLTREFEIDADGNLVVASTIFGIRDREHLTVVK